MADANNKNISEVLDSAQLTRIESVHRGFLYQHLYAVGCLLLAQTSGVQVTLIERDEDIELITKKERIYIQVKTRSRSIIPSDITDALQRFSQLRKEHNEGHRKGNAFFILVANQVPSVELQQTIDEKKLPADVHFFSPGIISEFHLQMPPAWDSLPDAISWCISRAEKLNFSLLSPDSLIWKLAGLVQLAATGSYLNKQHAFDTVDLPTLFEQLIVQLQDFPAPPTPYRPQKQEPLFTSNQSVRIICGLSGAGKTAWAAQAALHYFQLCAYYDTGDLPGPALASTLVRELAAKFGAADRDGFRKILLPGASGYEALTTFNTFLEQQGITLLLVLDNAHRIPVENLRDVLKAAKSIHFILLCQPHENVRQLEAITGLQREALLGWDIDTVAAAVGDVGGFGTALGYENLRVYTGGLPLYVQSAANVAVTAYSGDIDAMCNELQRQENSIETAQEVILSRVYESFDQSVQDSLALFSLSDVGLSSNEVSELLIKSLNISAGGAATIVKRMRATGTIQVFGNQTFKVHDAVRALGLKHFELMNQTVASNALVTLKELLIKGLQQTRDTSRFSLLTQIFIKLNDVMTLIAISGEELFFEMGINVDILAILERASVSEKLEPINKFWALDGLVFAQLREGPSEKTLQHLNIMEMLLEEHKFSAREEIAYTMKKMLLVTDHRDIGKIRQLADEIRPKLPDTEHQRIFNFNYAVALWKLKKFKEAETLCRNVIDEFYGLLGITPADVIGKNSDVLWTIIKRPENTQDHLKHLADALELYAKCREAQGKETPFIRIHSMKFYNMACAPDSMVRVGQDLADEFVGKKDYQTAKNVMEEHVLPVVNQMGLINRLIQVRSQYAVILALCGMHDDADAEMERLAPYLDGLTMSQRHEVENQSNYIAHLAHNELQLTIKQMLGKVRRNDPCPCGSGLKYKICHGF